MRTRLKLVSTQERWDILSEKSGAWSRSGGRKVHSIITHDLDTPTENREAQLLELLSYLERRKAELTSRYYEGLDILTDAMTTVRAELCDTIYDTAGTDE